MALPYFFGLFVLVRAASMAAHVARIRYWNSAASVVVRTIATDIAESAERLLLEQQQASDGFERLANAPPHVAAIQAGPTTCRLILVDGFTVTAADTGHAESSQTGRCGSRCQADQQAPAHRHMDPADAAPVDAGGGVRSPRSVSFTATLQLLATNCLLSAIIGRASELLQLQRATVLCQGAGHRPGRIEPRANKRRPNVLALLNQPRRAAIEELLVGA